MRLNDEEQAMVAGEMGPAVAWAVQHQMLVGEFFDAADLVPVAQSHIMADTESLGNIGVEWLEDLLQASDHSLKVVIPTTTDPWGTDFKQIAILKQDREFVELERRAITAFKSMGVLMTDSCINYQAMYPPVRGEHLALGDTGVAIQANGVAGARSNFEGGPSAIAAALTGRTPRYGFHLDSHRRGGCLFEIDFRPGDLAEWGALGGIIGRAMTSYWQVPVIAGIAAAPTSDKLKQFGAALASFGSTAMFLMVGVSPDAPDLQSCFDGPLPAATKVRKSDIAAFTQSYLPADDHLDVVVFSGPQLSLVEIQCLAGLLDGRRVHDDVTLLAASPPEVKAAADRMGFTEIIETAGGTLLEGVCFYQMHAREIGEANGWKRLMSNSAKIVNILGGYDYQPVLASMEVCVNSAVAGKILK